MFAASNPNGRLVTLRITPPVDDDNADRAALEVRTLVGSISSRIVMCTDLTLARTFAPATTDRWLQLMKSDNPRLERSAILLGTTDATLHLQIERMVKEAASPARRTFRAAIELGAWLDEVLRPEERAALKTFLEG